MDKVEFGKNGGENALQNLKVLSIQKLPLKMEKTSIYMGTRLCLVTARFADVAWVAVMIS